jgi:hypothetical protein
MGMARGLLVFLLVLAGLAGGAGAPQGRSAAAEVAQPAASEAGQTPEPCGPVGQPAAFFSLPAIPRGEFVDSDTLFEGSTVTLLAFWTTHCAECVRRLEICQELQDWGRGAGLGVVGVNFDDAQSARLELMVRQATPRMIQLHDAGGVAASRYGAGAHSFTAYLVDADGMIRDVLCDISADSLAHLRPRLGRLMEETLEEPAEEGAARESHATAPAGEGGPGSDALLQGRLLEKLGAARERLAVHGIGRVRWMNIDTTGTGATGPFGEAVEPGSSLRHRLELELTYAITHNLRAGGLIWLSNEGEAVLRSGPDYLSVPWGSAFLRYDTSLRTGALGRLFSSLRVGYYDVSFTPLTLMRWDEDDSPISGGQRVQGCGVCGGEAGLAGFIRSESLERLAPEYTFEGAHWTLSLGEIDLPFDLGADLTAIYARPHEHWPEKRSEFDPQDPEDLTALTFRQEIYGGRLANHFSLPWSADPATFAGTLLYVRDDRDDWPPWRYWPTDWPQGELWPRYAPGTDRLAGLSLRLPLAHRLEADGEIVQSRWDAEDTPRFAEDAEPIEATAFRGQARIDLRPAGGPSPLDVLPEGMTAVLQAGYQRTGTDFFSPYSALSYEANVHPSQEAPLTGLEGARGSLRVDWWRFGLGLFVKSLQPVDEEAVSTVAQPGGERHMASIWVDVESWPGGTLTLGWVKDDRDPLASQTIAPKEKRRIWVLNFEQELAARATLILEGQWQEGEREGDSVDPGEEEYSSRTVRVMMDVEF